MRAKFVESVQPRLGGDTTRVILKALHQGQVKVRMLRLMRSKKVRVAWW